MLFRKFIVSEFGRLIDDAQTATLKEMTSGESRDEPTITKGFLDAIKYRINGFHARDDVEFRAYVFQPQGYRSDEWVAGADFLGVLRVNLDEFIVTKGFLAQAKKESREIGVEIPVRGATKASFNYTEDFKGLQGQAKKMLSQSPSSYVFLYSPKGFAVVPAISVTSLTVTDTLYAKTARGFFQEFLMCFIGDKRLGAFSNAEFERLVQEFRAGAGILIEARRSDSDGYSLTRHRDSPI